MEKISAADKMRMQALGEQNLGLKPSSKYIPRNSGSSPHYPPSCHQAEHYSQSLVVNMRPRRMFMFSRDLHLKSFRGVPAQIINDAMRQKRLENCTARTAASTEPLSDEARLHGRKRTYLIKNSSEPTVNKQNNRFWSAGEKADVRTDRLLIERESLRSTWWCRLECVGVLKADSSLCTRKPRSTPTTMWVVYYPR